jgi:hopene-associated glycosyltransferase HpnB
MIAEGLAVLTLLIWLYLLIARGGFWRIAVRKPRAAATANHSRIAIVIPARDEAATVAACIGSCAAQTFRGAFHIFLVDDHSTDRTVELTRGAVPDGCLLTVVPAKPLPAGWTGKLWALECGLEQARSFEPEYVLLTDADIVHSPDTLATLVDLAQTGQYDLASFMVKLRCSSFAERVLIPAFVYFFFKLYPPQWIEDTRTATAGAAGGCILIRTSALDRIGGVASICGELIDDCALAQRVKRTGGKIWLGLTASSASIREYNTFGEIRRMISRTAFTQLNYSALMLVGTVIAMVITYVMPPLLLFTGNGRAMLS